MGKSPIKQQVKEHCQRVRRKLRVPLPSGCHKEDPRRPLARTPSVHKARSVVSRSVAISLSQKTQEWFCYQGDYESLIYLGEEGQGCLHIGRTASESRTRHYAHTTLMKSHTVLAFRYHFCVQIGLRPIGPPFFGLPSNFLKPWLRLTTTTVASLRGRRFVMAMTAELFRGVLYYILPSNRT